MRCNTFLKICSGRPPPLNYNAGNVFCNPWSLAINLFLKLKSSYYKCTIYFYFCCCLSISLFAICMSSLLLNDIMLVCKLTFLACQSFISLPCFSCISFLFAEQWILYSWSWSDLLAIPKWSTFLDSGWCLPAAILFSLWYGQQ